MEGVSQVGNSPNPTFTQPPLNPTLTQPSPPNQSNLKSRAGLFCEMDALCHFDTGEYGWKKSAR